MTEALERRWERRLRLLTIAFAPVAAGLLIACDSSSAGGSEAPMQQDSAGISVVSNSGSDRPLAWATSRLWSIGGVHDSSVTLTRVERGYIAADTAGRVYLLDEGSRQVLRLTDRGRVEARIGRGGDGPGELRNPAAIDVASNGDLLVLDPGKGRILRGAPHGAAGGETRIRALAWGRMLRATMAGHLYPSRRATSAGSWTTLTRDLGDSDTTLAAVLEPPVRPARYPSCPEFQVQAPALFAPSLRWDADDRRIAVVTGPEYRVDIIEGGRIVRSIRRGIRPAQLTEQLAAREWGEALEIPRLGCRIPAEEIVRVRGYAPLLPVIREVAFGPRGELWVLRSGSGRAANRIDVFDARGAYLGTLPAEVPFPAAFVGANRIVAVDLDTLGVPVVTALRIDR